MSDSVEQPEPALIGTHPRRRGKITQYPADSRDQLRQARCVLPELLFESTALDGAYVGAQGFDPRRERSGRFAFEAATPKPGQTAARCDL